MSSHRSLAEACSCLLTRFPFNKGVEDKSSFPFWTAGGCLLQEAILYLRATPWAQQCLLLLPGLSPKDKISIELEEGAGWWTEKDPSGMAVLNTQGHLSLTTGSSTGFSIFEASKLACQWGIAGEKENVTRVSRTVLGTDTVPAVSYRLDVMPDLYFHIILNIW